MWNEDLVSEVVKKVYCPYFEDRPNTLPRLWLVVPNNHSKLLPEVRFVRTGLGTSNDRNINCLAIGRSIPKDKQKALDISHALHIPELRSIVVQQVNLRACTDWSIPPLSVVCLERTKLACQPRFPSTLRILYIKNVEVLDQAGHENILVGLAGQDLPNLIKLVVNGCRQSGQIPVGINKFKKLVELDLSGNLLSGTIPTNLGDLTSLESLNLSHNCLEGTIPTELEKLTCLDELVLAHNKLEGQVPLVHVESVFCVAHNELCGVFPDIKSEHVHTEGNVFDNQAELQRRDMRSYMRLNQEGSCCYE